MTFLVSVGDKMKVNKTVFFFLQVFYITVQSVSVMAKRGY